MNDTKNSSSDRQESACNACPEELVALFQSYFGTRPEMALRLPGAGGDRIYWRLFSSAISAIGVKADNMDEARAFINLSEVFFKNKVKVPKFYAASADCSYYLQEDLGSTDLFSNLTLAKEEFCEDPLQNILAVCMRQLAGMQTVPEECWREAVAFEPLSSRLVNWDLNYFKYEFLKPSGINFSEDKLEDDFYLLCNNILEIPENRWGFMMRDCQSRNIMVKDGNPYLIDYQGGRKGPCLYDAVSFLWQAKAGFKSEIREVLLNIYADCFCQRRNENAASSESLLTKEDFLSDLPVLRLFRCLQVLGAYGFRGLVQHRAHFIESIPMALSNLSELIAEGAVDSYPELKRIASELVKDSRFSPIDNGGRLRISVFSFSYKKGYPEDFTGNGGGFMFDCRALHNPGRYDEYKQLTGLDFPVIEFLESRGEIGPFLEAASALVIPAVERYLKRGFSSLQVGFGCTGGQHRSVYSASHLAKRLAELFPQAEVVENHRERGVVRVYRDGRVYDINGKELKV